MEEKRLLEKDRGDGGDTGLPVAPMGQFRQDCDEKGKRWYTKDECETVCEYLELLRAIWAQVGSTVIYYPL